MTSEKSAECFIVGVEFTQPSHRNYHFMNWQEIQTSYPQQWLLIEATNAHSDSGKRVLDEIQVVDSFKESSEALQRYAKLHHEAPDRELYVFHTSRDSLEIAERQWLGVRVAG